MNNNYLVNNLINKYDNNNLIKCMIYQLSCQDTFEHNIISTMNNICQELTPVNNDIKKFIDALISCIIYIYNSQKIILWG